jgi:hypothetical protein
MRDAMTSGILRISAEEDKGYPKDLRRAPE